MALNSQTPPPYFSSQWPSLILENFRTIDEFQAATVSAINNIASAGNALGNQLNQLTQKQTTDQQNDASDLNALQDQITKLQQQVGGLTTSFQTLQSDNAQFKSNVTAQIQNFQSTLDGFQGQLTALQQATSQNTTDISKLKAAYDPTLWDQMTKAFQSIGLIIANAINEYDKTVVQPALAKIRTDLATQGTDQAEQITEIALRVEELAILVRRATLDWSKLAEDLQTELTQEVKDREAMGERNYKRITQERTRAIQKETALGGEIVALQENVDQNKKDAADGTATVKNLVTAETARAKGEEQILSGEIADNKLAIDGEVKRANTAESNLQNNLNAETNARVEADKDLNQRCDDIKQTAQNAVNSATDAVNTANQTEANAKQLGNTLVNLQGEIDAAGVKIAGVEQDAQSALSLGSKNQDDLTLLEKNILVDASDPTKGISAANVYLNSQDGGDQLQSLIDSLAYFLSVELNPPAFPVFPDGSQQTLLTYLKALDKRVQDIQAIVDALPQQECGLITGEALLTGTYTFKNPFTTVPVVRLQEQNANKGQGSKALIDTVTTTGFSWDAGTLEANVVFGFVATEIKS